MRPPIRRGLVAALAVFAALACAVLAAALPALLREPAAAPTPEPARRAHFRLLDEHGTLLLTTWPHENGTWQDLEPANRSATGVPWTARDASPLWRPLAPMLAHAPANVTLRLEGYDAGPLALGTATLPRVVELPLRGNLSREAAARIFGGYDPGMRTRFLGTVPVEILSVEGSRVEYRFVLEAPLEFDAARLPGLRVNATADGGVARFAFALPAGAFTAHKNCALPAQTLPAGRYVVESETAGAFTLVRYMNEAERRLDGRTVTIETLFLGPAAGHEAPHGHDHEESP